MNVYNSLCDDFCFEMYVNTELDLPSGRDTVLTFFERMQKQFPSMSGFFRRGKNEYWLESSRSKALYRWLALERDRVNSGVANPSEMEQGYSQHRAVLELVPYMLSLSHLDVSSLDVTFGMDFDCFCNHEEVIAEAVLGSSAFGSLLDLPGARALEVCPSVAVSISEDGNTQARVTVESGRRAYDAVGREHEGEEAIRLSFTVRQYPSGRSKFDTVKSFERQCRLGEELMSDKIIPYFVQPLTSVIAGKRMS